MPLQTIIFPTSVAKKDYSYSSPKLSVINVIDVLLAKYFKDVVTQVAQVTLCARESQMILCAGLCAFDVVYDTFYNFLAPVFFYPIENVELRVFGEAGHGESVEFSHDASVKYLSFVLHQSQAQRCSCAWWQCP